jgi:hypothetical protein
MANPTGNPPGPQWLGQHPVTFGAIAGVLAAGVWFGVFSFFPQKRIALSIVVAVVVGIVVGASVYAMGSGHRRRRSEDG